MRYLPSVVVFVALVATLFFVDRQQIKGLKQQKRVAAESILRNVQTQIDTIISRTVRGLRGLAAELDPAFNIDQQTFAELVKSTDTGPAKIARAELAPGFITRLVYPQKGNEVYVGKSPLRQPTNGLSPLQSDVARGFPALAKVNVLENGIGELHVRTELREVVANTVISTGLLHLVKQFEISIDDPTGKFTPEEIDFYYQVRPAGGAPPELPESWQASGSMEPINYTMRYPPGDFLLFARPKSGWDITTAETASHRMQFSILGLFLLLPVVLANWFAVSRVATMGRLSRTQKQMTGLLQNLPGSAFTYTIPAGRTGPGPDDRISFLNPDSCIEIWGVDAKLVERDPNVIWDKLVSEDVVAQLSGAFLRSMQSMAPLNETFPIETEESEHKWLRCSAVPARNGDGSVYWSALVIDYTEAIQREDELEKQQELAFRAQKNEIVMQLTGGAAHDFNNLLAVILGNLELLQGNPDHRDRHELLEESINSTLRGADLTKSMLAFARKSRLKPVLLQLNDLVIEMRRWIERTLPASITVQMDLADDLWYVSADRSSTESAFLNLILNARDAMDERGILAIETALVTIEESNLQSQPVVPAAGRYVVLSVTDNGSGITDEDLDNIYEPFFSTKETGKGSGLGLSMVMGFMQQSYGAVVATTEKGKGTEFKLYFPAVNQTQVREIVPQNKQTGNHIGARILLTEDDAGVRVMLRRTLENEGFQVIATASGDEALSVFNDENAFDLLLTGMILPGELQGPEIASTLQARHPELAVVFISGFSSAALLIDPEAQSEIVVLTKPVKRAELITLVNNALNAQKQKVPDNTKIGIADI